LSSVCVLCPMFPVYLDCVILIIPLVFSLIHRLNKPKFCFILEQIHLSFFRYYPNKISK
jgi:hypothetical protein